MEKISIGSYSKALVSSTVAERIAKDLCAILRGGSKVTLDFEGVVMITTQCANAILKSAFEMVGSEFKNMISFSNASPSVSYLLSDAMDYIMKNR